MPMIAIAINSYNTEKTKNTPEKCQHVIHAGIFAQNFTRIKRINLDKTKISDILNTVSES